MQFLVVEQSVFLIAQITPHNSLAKIRNNGQILLKLAR